MSNGRLYALSHATYRCEYHLVWTPKYRGKIIADKYIKAELKRIFKAICRWKGFHILGWHVGDEHIHLYVSIPPKYSVAYAMAILKGKSSAWIKKKTKQIPQGSYWCRGYFVSTVGVNELVIRKYIENQRPTQPPAPTLPVF
jgi:putative transposase